MASKPNMTAPICLVENIDEQLSVNQEALQILDQISQPVVVVAIVGLYRTGKSYLMNRLAGQNHGECCPQAGDVFFIFYFIVVQLQLSACLLYTSDAADDANVV